MKKRMFTYIFLCFCAAGILVNSTAHAFNGEKSGFILGFGPGLGWVHNDFTLATQKKASFKTDFLIGWGLGNGQTLITWSSKVLWYDSGGTRTTSGTGGLGITHFLNQDNNAMFLSGVIGVNSIAEPFDASTAESGFGLGLGVGKEFSKNWLIGLDATWGKPVSGLTTFGVGVHISHLWY